MVKLNETLECAGAPCVLSANTQCHSSSRHKCLHVSILTRCLPSRTCLERDEQDVQEEDMEDEGMEEVGGMGDSDEGQ